MGLIISFYNTLLYFNSNIYIKPRNVWYYTFQKILFNIFKLYFKIIILKYNLKILKSIF